MTRLFFTLVIFVSSSVCAGELVLAVASNFGPTVNELKKEFSKINGCKVKIVTGSSGKLATQIFNGAPFDIFMSADSIRSRWLIDQKRAIAKSHRVYALGQLVLFSAHRSLDGQNIEKLILDSSRKIVIANPLHAPYGKSAQVYLRKMKLWEKIQSKVIHAENAAQAMQFAISGQHLLAFVSLAQAITVNSKKKSFIHLAQAMAPLIQQSLVITHKGKNNRLASKWSKYLSSRSATSIIRKHGYIVPTPSTTLLDQ